MAIVLMTMKEQPRTKQQSRVEESRAVLGLPKPPKQNQSGAYQSSPMLLAVLVHVSARLSAAAPVTCRLYGDQLVLRHGG